jgi:CRP-like cAMP-binding protein
MTAPKESTPHRFDVHEFLDSAGVSRRVARFTRGARIFAQGAPAASVFYIQAGQVKRSVLSSGGKEAVVAILGPGDSSGRDALPASPVSVVLHD